MANTKISALTALTNPTWNEELVYAYNNANGKMTLDTMKTFASADSQATLVSGVNIKTINWTSILGSGNIDVSWWGGGGWFEPTELGWDANIWELSEWAYVTTYDLYYQSGAAVPAGQADDAESHKHMLFVVSTWSGQNAYFVITEYNISTLVFNSSCIWKSASSSNGTCERLWDRQYALNVQWAVTNTGSIVALNNAINQVVTNANDTSQLQISSWQTVMSGLTYSVYISSVQSTYTVTLWNWITNPFNVTLPSASNKQSLIRVFMTSTTTWIVTDCIIAS